MSSQLPEASFSALIFSFATTALIHLGFEKNPHTGQNEVDKNLAQMNIDWLLILKSKTEGNLSPEEANYLNSVINDLQLKFIQAR